MPLTQRLSPMARPSGTAVAKATRKAIDTRVRLLPACCSRVASAKPSRATVTKACATSNGEGRKSGVTSRSRATRNHSARNPALATRLIRRLDPGLAKARTAGLRLLPAAEVARASAGESGERATMVLFSCLVDQLADLLAQSHELRVGFDGAGVAGLSEAAHEIERVAPDDPPRARRHDDHLRPEEQRLLDGMGDEEDALAGPGPDLDDLLLHRLA